VYLPVDGSEEWLDLAVGVLYEDASSAAWQKQLWPRDANTWRKHGATHADRSAWWR